MHFSCILALLHSHCITSTSFSTAPSFSSVISLRLYLHSPAFSILCSPFIWDDEISLFIFTLYSVSIRALPQSIISAPRLVTHAKHYSNIMTFNLLDYQRYIKCYYKVIIYNASKPTLPPNTTINYQWYRNILSILHASALESNIHTRTIITYTYYIFSWYRRKATPHFIESLFKKHSDFRSTLPELLPRAFLEDAANNLPVLSPWSPFWRRDIDIFDAEKSAPFDAMTFEKFILATNAFARVVNIVGVVQASLYNTSYH